MCLPCPESRTQPDSQGHLGQKGAWGAWLSMKQACHRLPVNGALLPHPTVLSRKQAWRGSGSLGPVEDWGRSTNGGPDLAEALPALEVASTQHLLGDGLWEGEPAAALRADNVCVHLL